MIDITGHFIGQGIIGHIHHRKHIRSADRFVDDSLGLSGAESGALTVQQVRIHIVTAVLQILLPSF